MLAKLSKKSHEYSKANHNTHHEPDIPTINSKPPKHQQQRCQPSQSKLASHH